VKVGTENRNKLIAAAVLGVVALVLIGRMLFPSAPSEPEATVVAPVAAAPASRPAGKPRFGARRVAAGPPHSIDPSLRYDWLKASEDTKYEGNGRNIFLAQAEIPQPIKNGEEEKLKAAQGPPPPPPPPPINLKFYGFASKPGEPKKVFLSQGEDVFIASEGEIVDRRYKVLHISPVSVEIEDVLSNNRQMIPLTQS
jgi:hypothetical protein